MPTLKIDGQEVTVDRGTTVLQAAAKLGIEVPTFCYHPGLSIPANCRMCLVEVEGRDPNRPPPPPIPACHAQAQEGMVINTDNERVRALQEAVLEFILLNHPVDCPICDQSGECVLQDHYFKYSAQPSRLATRKVHKPKVKPLGPDILLDAERCILCTRCVRFCDEVAKESQLEMINRGEHSEITTFPGKELDNPYSGNTVDICPVGALTSKSFRFRTRVWFLQSAESVCTECSRGCKIRVDTFENTPRRYKPLENPNVNGWWMCDKGRTSFGDYLNGRVEAPLIRDNGKRRATRTNEAVGAALAALKSTQSDKIGVVITPWFTNEDAYLVGKLLQKGLSGAQVFLGGRPDGASDDILIQADKNPNRRGVEAVMSALGVAFKPLADLDMSAIDTLLVFGDQHSFSEAQVAGFDGVKNVIATGAFMGPAWKASSVFLPGRLHWEKAGSFTNFEGVVQSIDRATKANGTCKSEGYYAMKLAEGFGQTLGFRSPQEVFGALVRDVPGFANMEWWALKPHGLKLGGA